MKVYVQPAWMEDSKAVLIAKGELDISAVTRPESLVPFSMAIAQESNDKTVQIRFDDAKIRKELVELRSDFFNKIQELQNAINKAYQEIYNLKNARQEIDIDEVVSKVLQKASFPQPTVTSSINEEQIVQKVLAKIPRSAGSVTYEVAPLEKIKKDFLQKAKDKVYADVAALDDYQKQALKFVETQGKDCSLNLILEKCFHLSGSSGGNRKKLSEKIDEMTASGVMRKDKNGIAYPGLKERIKELVEPFGGNDQDIQQVYDHILAEMLNGK